MGATLSSRRRHYVERVGTFLLAIVLIAGMTGCDPKEQNLTISSTAGGSVITPGTGTFVYQKGTKVNLEAISYPCYEFVSWIGDVGTIADVEAATTTINMNDDYSITASFTEAAVTFADPNLEAAVRDAIAIPSGPIYLSDLAGLTYLDASAKNITDLTGLECATSLTYLELRSNQISDISPLANLTNLTELYLMYNQISDVSPLVNLTSLMELYLDDNEINDMSPLASLTGLTRLWLPGNQMDTISSLANLTGLTRLNLENNQIDDISPLANLTNLTWIDLGVNQIGDISPLTNLASLTVIDLEVNQISNISPLANLASLTYVDLDDNQIIDVSPLVQNQGLGTGDEVWLRANPLSFDSINIHIPQLQARGVTVTY